MLLNEQIVEKAEVVKDGLPKGVLARVWYPIMRFGVKNANKRIYTKEVGERVLSDSRVLSKLKTRTLFGNQEHPQESQVKLDWQQTSHVISEFRYNDDGSVLSAAFDLLPSQPGQFIFGLLEAGCLVGVSTRAEGELEEATDESSGEQYFKVIPDKYMFETVDFTGDPSTPDALPEDIQKNVINTVKSNYESKKMERPVAIALLEKVNNAESKILEGIIKADKQHKDCTCKLEGKKCSSGCAHLREQPNFQAQSESKTNEEIAKCPKCGLVYDTKLSGGCQCPECNKNESKIQEDYEATKEVTIDVPTPNGEDVNVYTATLVVVIGEDKNYGADADNKGGRVSKWIKSYEIASVADMKGNPVEITQEIKDAVDKEVQNLDPYWDFTNECFKFTKHIIEAIDPKSLTKVTLVDKKGKKWRLFKNDKGQIIGKDSGGYFVVYDNSSEAEKDGYEIQGVSEAVDGEVAPADVASKWADAYKALVNLEHALPEGLDMKELWEGWKAVQQKLTKLRMLRPMGESSPTPNLSIDSGVNETITSLCKGETIDSKVEDKDVAEGKSVVEIAKQLKEAKITIASITADRDKAVELAETYESRIKEISENYAKDVISLTAQLQAKPKEVEKVVEKIVEKVVEKPVEKIVEKAVVPQETLKLIVKQKTDMDTMKAGYEQQIKVLKESNIQEVAKVKRDNQKALLKKYYETKLATMGLRISSDCLTLLEQCTTEQAIDDTIEIVRQRIRTGLLHSDKLTEVKVPGKSQSPEQARLEQKVTIAMDAVTGRGTR
jgi:hypothetical protein